MSLALQGISITSGITFGALPYAQGLYYRRYSGYFNDNVSWFATASLVAEQVMTSPISDGFSGDLFSVEWLGWFLSAYSETHTFYTTSDDASYLWVGPEALSGFTTSNAIVNNGGLHAPQERSGSIALVANTYYPMRIQFGENTGGDDMSVSVSSSSIGKTTNLSPYIFYNTNTKGF
jgi:hypothetical protein